MSACSEVLWVLDTEFGDKALACSPDCAVWAVTSGENDATVQRAQAAGRPFTLLFPNGVTREQWFFNHLDTIDQHHNEHSQAPAYSVLRVVGVSLSPRVTEWLKEFGFVQFTPNPLGFVARKPAGVVP